MPRGRPITWHARRSDEPGSRRRLREEAGLTQRQIGAKLKKLQSWIFNCESGNRRVDVAEFAAWATACAVDPERAFKMFLRLQG